MRSLAVLAAVTAALASCGAPGLDAPPAYESSVVGVADAPALTPEGRIVVAYPEEPDEWYPDHRAEPAAVDLAHLWGLPLFRVDPSGQLRPYLAAGVREVEATDGWDVEIELREGSWSDGVPVTAHDVVATIEWLRQDAARAPAIEALTSATAADDRTVRLSFAEPTGRWAYVLAGGWSVLPAHVLADQPDLTSAVAPTVSGGPFTVVEQEAGRRIVARAHPGSPVGAPGLEEIEVAFVPDFETALGLLEDDRADVLLGYLALNPVERASALADVRTAAPLGGTSLVLAWDGDGVMGGPGQVDRRAAVRASVDVRPQVEGLLGPIGRVATSLLPGASGPWGADTPARSLEGLSPAILVPRWQEAPGFTARALQRDLRTFGGSAELVRVEPDDLVRSTQGDGRLAVRRDGPWPSLLARTTSDDTEDLRTAARSADRAGTRSSTEVELALRTFFEQGHVLPLYEIGVAHAWRSRVGGIEPSSWPGLAMWNVGRWTVSPS